ncbi:MAG: hypothetical protein IKX00_00715 [Bacilli bacterium]|nr:hypothetical protein [Bacilli bacterium]
MKIINLMQEKQVDNYISGKGRFSDKKLEEVQNNPSFMMCAINKSNDPKLYRFCSHEVKMNYNFLKFYIGKFKDNIEAIDKAAGYFLEHSEDDFLNFEISILMKNLTLETHEDYCIKYGLIVESISLVDDCMISSYIDDLKDDKSKEMFGLGFLYLKEMYKNNDLITEHYAKRLITNLFENNNESIEAEIHKRFKTIEEFQKYGFTKYFVDYILKFDQELASYIQINYEVLDVLKYKMENIYNRWNFYVKQLNYSRYDQILNVYDEYMTDINPAYDDNYYALLKYIMKKEGISDELFEVDDEISEEDFDEILGIKKPINLNFYDNDKLEKLIETIQLIQRENDPEAIKNIHLEKDECVVTRLRAKITSITQL